MMLLGLVYFCSFWHIFLFLTGADGQLGAHHLREGKWKDRVSRIGLQSPKSFENRIFGGMDIIMERS